MTRRWRVTGIPGEVDADDPNVDVGFEQRRHMCYHFAAEYVLRATEPMTLVHGTIRSEEWPDLPPLEHAWVETESGHAFEPTSGHRMTLDEFRGYFNPVERKRYDEDAVYRLTMGVEHWGPWTEDEWADALEMEF